MTNTLGKSKLKANILPALIGLLPSNQAVSMNSSGGGIYFDILVYDKHFEIKTQSKDTPALIGILPSNQAVSMNR